MSLRRLVAVLAVVALGLVGAPAAAETQPHFTDPCGAVGLAGNPADGATTPWTDICSGQFETLADGSLRLTVRYAGDIADDRFGYYLADWRAGDCSYRVSHDNGLGEVGSNGVFVSDPGGDWLRVRCGAGVEVPCPPVTTPASGTCLSYPNEKHYQLVDAVTVVGDAVTWTLRFTGELAFLDTAFAPGTTLTKTRTYASTKIFLAAFAPGYCYGTQCGEVGGDLAAGRSYTVGE
jgi:hypothetical protein